MNPRRCTHKYRDRGDIRAPDVVLSVDDEPAGPPVRRRIGHAFLVYVDPARRRYVVYDPLGARQPYRPVVHGASPTEFRGLAALIRALIADPAADYGGGDDARRWRVRAFRQRRRRSLQATVESGATTAAVRGLCLPVCLLVAVAARRWGCPHRLGAVAAALADWLAVRHRRRASRAAAFRRRLVFWYRGFVVRKRCIADVAVHVGGGSASGDVVVVGIGGTPASLPRADDFASGSPARDAWRRTKCCHPVTVN